MAPPCGGFFRWGVALVGTTGTTACVASFRLGVALAGTTGTTSGVFRLAGSPLERGNRICWVCSPPGGGRADNRVKQNEQIVCDTLGGPDGTANARPLL